MTGQGYLMFPLCDEKGKTWEKQEGFMNHLLVPLGPWWDNCRSRWGLEKEYVGTT